MGGTVIARKLSHFFVVFIYFFKKKSLPPHPFLGLSFINIFAINGNESLGRRVEIRKIKHCTDSQKKSKNI